jgi:hypothetical protein
MPERQKPAQSSLRAAAERLMSSIDGNSTTFAVLK